MSTLYKGAKPSRRSFLSGALAAGGAIAGASMARAQAAPEKAITEVQPWRTFLGDGVDARPYGVPSEHEKHVVRRGVEWLTADNVSSINFTPLHELDGIITPNGICFERHHGGTAHIDPAEHRLMINGLVDKQLVFTIQDLMRFPRENHVYFLECAANTGMEWAGAQLNGVQFTHGMIHNVMYTGVPLRLLLEEAGVKPNGKWLLAEGADASGMTRSIPLEKALDDCLVAWKMNGEALRPEFKTYIQQVITNAKALSDQLIKGGLDTVTHGTDTHVVLVDLRPKGVKGNATEKALGRAHITCNKNGVPFDPEKPMVTSGIRLGSPAGTTRGFAEPEFRQIADWIVEVVDGLAQNGEDGNGEVEANVKAQVEAMCQKFPMYPDL